MYGWSQSTLNTPTYQRIKAYSDNFVAKNAPLFHKRVSEGKFAIMGNVNTTDLLMASPAEIARQVIVNLEAGVDIISPGCAISPQCPNANLQEMARAIRRWHRSHC